jgi:TPP-dependent pyruvate/acetoin dehydrogenase alpha subunit
MTELHSGPVTELLDQHRRMALIRVFEETTPTLYAAGEIPGFVHLSVGQEAVPVGVCSAWVPTVQRVLTEIVELTRDR